MIMIAKLGTMIVMKMKILAINNDNDSYVPML